MKLLAILLLLSSAKLAWADPMVQSVAYVSAQKSGCILSTGTIVYMATATYTLDEFVSSGKFCKFNGGHHWVSVYDSDMIWAAAEGEWAEESHEWQPYGCERNSWYCLVCHRCRQKIKVQKQEEIWEP